MKKILIPLVAMVAVLAVAAGASARPDKAAAATADACVLLPDTKSSVRWETQDRRFLATAFKNAGVSSVITNAEGSAQRMRSQADQCLTNGAKVILMVNLDSGSGRAIQNAAVAKGAKVIDYDRLTLGGKAAYYVSFNNPKVGELMGKGIVADLRAKGVYSKKPVVAKLNGGPTDNNSKLFKQGYDSVLNPLIRNGTFKKGPDQWVPEWNNQKALTIFEQMLTQTNNNIQAVAAANDGLANAVVTALKARQLKPIAVSGQDATAQGIQNVISGWQSGSVYKSIRSEASAAATAAIALVKGTPVKANGKTFDGKRNVPSILLTPVWITKRNYTLLFSDGFLKKSEVCRGQYAQYCK